MTSRIAALLLVLALTGCAATPMRHTWEDRLRGDTIVLLGEVHDNAEHHRQRLEVLRRAFATGWRPAIAMEQFDRERQTDIERARRERPRDAQHVIDLATPAGKANRGNWNWNFYRPFVELALEYEVPLIAANLSSADISKVVREGYAAVFDAQTLSALGLDQPVPATVQAAQEREIEVGHCNALPAKMVPVMARGQLARDAVMASIVNQRPNQGVVLLAGNGHVRRDIGVPHWLNAASRTRTLAIGFLEQSRSSQLEPAFDAVVRTAAAVRVDPCIEFIEFTKRMKPR
jgi:uncharacterized iron-regulated protein